MPSLSVAVIVSGAVDLKYPIIPVLESVVDLADEIVVNVDLNRPDGTAEMIDDQLRTWWAEGRTSGPHQILHQCWDWTVHDSGGEFRRQTDIALQACKGDWILSLQADEIVHEEDHGLIRSLMELPEDYAGAEFVRLCFWRDGTTLRTDWTLPLIRLFRKGRGRSAGDSQNCAVDGLVWPVDEGLPRIFHYCVTPETRILTADLQWVQSGSVGIDDWLLAFDEEPVIRGREGQGKTRRRRLRPAKIVHLVPMQLPTYSLTLSDGTKLRASSGHPWLATRQSDGRHEQWASVENIALDLARGRKIYMRRFWSPWASLDSYDAGYLAAALDGEGHITRPKHTQTTEIGFAQSNNSMLSEVFRILCGLGIAHAVTERRPDGVWTLRLNGSWHDKLLTLGCIRPKRLLHHLQEIIKADKMQIEFDARCVLEVVGAQYEGEQEVMGMETSTHTFFAEGFAAHNSRVGSAEEIGRRIYANDVMHHSEYELDPQRPYDWNLREVDGHLKGRDARLPRKDPDVVLERYDGTHPVPIRRWFGWP